MLDCKHDPVHKELPMKKPKPKPAPPSHHKWIQFVRGEPWSICLMFQPLDTSTQWGPMLRASGKDVRYCEIRELPDPKPASGKKRRRVP